VGWETELTGAHGLGVAVAALLLAPVPARLALPAAPRDPAHRGPCAPTPREDRLPGVIAAMAGHDPVWVVDGSSGRWLGGTAAVKTVWVLSRAGRGPLSVEGRRLDGDGVPTFRAGRDGAWAESLGIREPFTASVVPGGASPETMRTYAFVPSYVSYPSPGCWELVVRLGAQEGRIVVEVR